ncbi:AraC family transcriptional regulator [Paenibacillus radicis (ex Gao et al. 2016)]|uniref:HTH-type transcriptional regulator YdeC n=1 Tax=Paenibacillus radicis (ex Gao et al. 2016) TaxID=1737354 RepID=A0A917LRG9_9BACL|nr:AraC family transcriptional regulator [Paenibacillus radicis (ex Gao et al. 2016)]GGG53330.1 putative HTH-type transcriptional regulator YdeC [Paenibacillus radicis (ex Gao et al. 2016)]
MQLDVFSDLSEKLNYNLNNLDLYVKKGTLHTFDQLSATCHWHPDLEFISVIEGYMSFFVNGETVHLEKGSGIFVNSKRLHYGFSSDNSDCSYIVVCINSSLLGNDRWIGKQYWDEKFGSNTVDYIRLHDHVSWQQNALISLTQLYEEMHSPDCNPLQLLSMALSLCANIGDHIAEVKEHAQIDQSWIYVWKMTAFIHGNYENKIKLDDIAKAGSVSRSQCCILFDKYVGQPPNAYLIKYRIQKSCELLLHTDRSISEISISCGFQSASYYSFVFQKEMGIVPKEYRRKARC